jgi:diguanylate cyclase (GGDEF)-like protein
MVGPEGESLHVTMSIGVSTYADFIEIPEDMLKCADTALYFSKEHGRNKTTFYEENMQ